MRMQLALGLLVLALAQTALAQNRVPNGSFDQDTSPWFGAPASSAYTTLAWDSADANGLTSSGSARITNAAPSTSNASYVYSPCIPVTPGENLILSGRMLRPSGQGGANGGNGWIFLYWFNQSTCESSNAAFGTGPTPTTAAENEWITYELNPLAVPPEARGVRIGLIVARYASASSYTILFDDIALLGLGAAPSIAIDGPSTVEASSPATFTATAVGCEADEGRWSWNVGNGVIEGDDQGSSVRVTWSTAGQQSVSASHAACAGAVASSNVTVTSAGAQVVVSSIPEGLMQLTGIGGESTSYVLTNSGGAPATVTLIGTGDFFDHERSSITIAPGASEEVRIVARPMPAGSYAGESRISGAGVPSGLSVPIRLMVAHPPDGTVEASVPDPVREVRGSGAVVTGSFTLRNDGAAQLHGVVTTDASWLTVSPSTVSISSGGSTEIGFTSNRAEQNEAGITGGSATATAILRYLVPGGSSGSTGSAERPIESTSTVPTTGKTTVTVVDTRSLAVAVSALPALPFGELAWTLPLIDDARFDVAFAGRPASGPIEGLKLFLQSTPSPASARSVTLPTFGTSAITYANFLSSIFQTSVDAGALHMRSGANDSFVPVGTMHVDTTSGSARRAVPVFRSDRATGSETRLALPGLGRTAQLQTDLHIQEMTGNAAQATVELRNEAGAVMSSVVRDVPAFGALVIPNAVPDGAASAGIRLSGTGRIVAYGVRHDASGEQALVVDWGRVYGVAPGEPLVMPLVDRNDDQRLMLSIANASATEATTVTGELVPGGRRRGARRSAGASGTKRTWTVAPNASQTVADLEAAFGTARNGYVRFSSEGGLPAIVVQKVAASGNDGVATEAMPMTPASYANSSRGTVFVFDDVPEDVASDSGSVADLRLIEVKGAPARVRVRVTHPPKSGGGATAVAILARDFELQAHQSMDIPDILTAVIGSKRESLGALRNVTLTISALSGEGRVLGFLVERDLESQQWTIRAPM